MASTSTGSPSASSQRYVSGSVTRRPRRASGLVAHLQELHPQPHQGVCADAIASLEGISRDVLDALATESQARASRAIREGRFDRSLVSVHNLDGSLALDHAEFPRPSTTVESLAALPPSFQSVADYRHTDEAPTYRELVARKYPDLAIDHVHHAGNSSGVVDGAAAILIASNDYAVAHGLHPRARIRATANMGDDPTLMLNAPVPAARKVLQKGLVLSDIDLFERRDLQFGLITMCAGGGMAPATIIERL